MIYDKGMTPIEKNIVVIDEQGNQYEATYPKRARGLVNNGRARFIDEYTICLACPPNLILEEPQMQNNITPEAAIEHNDAVNEILHNDMYTDIAEVVRSSVSGEQPTDNFIKTKPSPTGLSLDWVLSRIDMVINNTAHINSTLEALKQIPPSAAGDVSSIPKSEAMAEIIKCRETTNQQTLKLLEKMYEDIKPLKSHKPIEQGKFEALIELAGDLPPIQKDNFIREMVGLSQNENNKPGAPLKQLRQMLDEVCAPGTSWDKIPEDIRNAVTQSITAQLSRSW